MHCVYFRRKRTRRSQGRGGSGGRPQRDPLRPASTLTSPPSPATWSDGPAATQGEMWRRGWTWSIRAFSPDVAGPGPQHRIGLAREGPGAAMRPAAHGALWIAAPVAAVRQGRCGGLAWAGIARGARSRPPSIGPPALELTQLLRRFCMAPVGATGVAAEWERVRSRR